MEVKRGADGKPQASAVEGKKATVRDVFFATWRWRGKKDAEIEALWQAAQSGQRRGGKGQGGRPNGGPGGGPAGGKIVRVTKGQVERGT